SMLAPLKKAFVSGPMETTVRSGTGRPPVARTRTLSSFAPDAGISWPANRPSVAPGPKRQTRLRAIRKVQGYAIGSRAFISAARIPTAGARRQSVAAGWARKHLATKGAQPNGAGQALRACRA